MNSYFNHSTLRGSFHRLQANSCPLLLLCICLALFGIGSLAHAGDQRQWGQAWSRNMVSSEKGLPDSFDPATGRNIKWTTQLGTESYSTPIVADGRVYIGTNNGEPRDPRHEGDRGVLMCLDEKNGHLLWQLVVPKREDDPFYDWPKTGISSPVTVEGNRVYLVSNRGEVICLDARGLANGNDGPFRDEGRHMALRGESAMEPGAVDADIIWLLDLTSAAGIWSHDAAHSSILIDGNYLYVNSGTGVDNTHRKIRTPDAPSLVVIDKRTGRMVARDDEHIAPNIFHCTWSSPSLGRVNGRPLVFLGAGNGIVYAFETVSRNPPEGEVSKLKKVWQFDFDPAAPKENIHKFTSNRREGPSNFYGMPVFDQDRIYIAGGGDLFWGKNEAWLKCIDARGAGDITKSNQVWSYALDKHALATPALHDGLLFIADCGRKFYCFDSKTGQPLWTDDITGDVWASPMVADGKVYLGTRSGLFRVYAAAKEKKVLSSIELKTPISATVTAANKILYISTMTRLYAVQQRAGK